VTIAIPIGDGGQTLVGDRSASSLSEIARAHRCLERFNVCENAEEYGDAWVQVLESTYAAWNKVTAAYKTEKLFQPWQGTWTHRRKADQGLNYAWHARNNRTHGLSELIHHEPGWVGVTGITMIHEKAYTTDGNIVPGKLIMGPTPILDSRRPSMTLIAVKDYGQTYKPPSTLGLSAAHELAIQVVNFYAEYVQQSAVKFDLPGL
jgi:hypothetical protein